MTSRTSVLAPIYSARDSAVTQRPTSTAILAIDSEDRFTDYDDARVSAGLNRSPYDFTINKTESIMNGFFTRLGVTEIVFPWVVPNINTATAVIDVTLQVGAGPLVPFQIELEIGFYTPSQIASQIQTLIRNFDPPHLGAFTMTYGTSSIGLSYSTSFPIFEYKTNAAGVTLAFHPISGAADPFFRERRRKQLFDLLGFSDANEVQELENYGTTTYCQATRYVDIVCSQLTANQALKDTMSQTVARDVLVRIYVGDAQGVQSTTVPSSSTFCPPGCMPTTIYKDYAQPKQIQWIPNQPVPGYLRFEVFDDAGFNLNDAVYSGGTAPNGTNWSMTMLVTEN